MKRHLVRDIFGMKIQMPIHELFIFYKIAVFIREGTDK